MVEMSHGLTKRQRTPSQGSWGLPLRRAGKFMYMRFGKDDPHEINEMALNVTL